MPRLGSTYPGGLPSIGLLLLRAAAGATAITEARAYLVDGGTSTGENWFMAFAGAGSGVALMLGFLTPITAALVSILTAAIGFSWVSPPHRNLFGEPLSAALLVIVAVAVALLGPGACSLDSCLFGRRKIIIPPMPGPRKHLE